MEGVGDITYINQNMNDDALENIYRPSSTIIIAVKSSNTEDGYNYRVLLAKRSAATAFVPGHYVFPGGVFDRKADESPKWIEHFEDFGILKEDLNRICLDHLPNRPKPLMTSGVNFSRDISLRITAIRETFEEVGLLLCVSRKDLKCANKAGGNYIHRFDRTHWQTKVHNNSMEFFNLCKYLDVIPDLWSLHEWSIWRSPATSLKKYDTAIYAVTLKDQPNLLLEPTEIEKELWSTPYKSLQLFRNRSIWLAPLQFYEISRLCNILDWPELKRFVQRRATSGSTLLMLAYFKCSDCVVGVLPGDDYYPANTLHHTETKQLSITDAEFKAKAKNIHRISFQDMYHMNVTSNITPMDDHLSPVTYFFNKNSKL